MDKFREGHVDGNDSSLFSPIRGKVVSIESSVNHNFFGEKLSSVQISLPFFKEIGIYLPVTSEIIDKRETYGKKKSRFIKNNSGSEELSSICLILQTPNKERVGMEITQCKFGAFPDIGVYPGDRGLRQVNIGNIPFGGTVTLYYPRSYVARIEIGMIVESGESVIAGPAVGENVAENKRINNVK